MPNLQQCRQGERWDTWKGQCVPESPLSSALQKKGGGTAPTTPSSPSPTGVPSTQPPQGVGIQPPRLQPVQPPGGNILTQQLQGGGANAPNQLLDGGGPQGAPPTDDKLQNCKDMCANRPNPNECRQWCDSQYVDPGGGGVDDPFSCNPPMVFNWITGQCVNPNQECPPGQSINTVTGQCQETSDPNQCGPNQTWSIAEGRCINNTELGGDCDPETEVYNWVLGRCVPIEGEEDRGTEEECVKNGGTWYDDPLTGGGSCEYAEGDEPPDEGDNEQLNACYESCEPKKNWDPDYYAQCRANCHSAHGTPCPKGQTRDQETGKCLDMCQAGYVWDGIRNQCIPEDESYLPDEEPECPQGQHWDSFREMCASGDPIVNPDEDILPDQPPDIFSDEFDTYLWEMLSQEGWAKADQELWDAKVARMDKEYERSRDQLEESLNVRGLYYSGARADAETELEQARTREMQVMASEHENEMYNRRLQQLELAANTALGQKNAEIKYALGKGELELGQIQLALEEMLGLSALDIQQQGLDQQMLSYMAELSLAEANTQIQRENIRLNVISILYGMGLSEEEVQSMWTQIAGSGDAPAL